MDNPSCTECDDAGFCVITATVTVPSSAGTGTNPENSGVNEDDERDWHAIAGSAVGGVVFLLFIGRLWYKFNRAGYKCAALRVALKDELGCNTVETDDGVLVQTTVKRTSAGGTETTCTEIKAPRKSSVGEEINSVDRAEPRHRRITSSGESTTVGFARPHGSVIEMRIEREISGGGTVKEVETHVYDTVAPPFIPPGKHNKIGIDTLPKIKAGAQLNPTAKKDPFQGIILPPVNPADKSSKSDASNTAGKSQALFETRPDRDSVQSNTQV
jgi:hypothetical protein